LRFYQHYAPDKTANVDSILQAYQGRENEIIPELERKYGPEPGVNHKMRQVSSQSSV
jgi:hypothetical protein